MGGTICPACEAVASSKDLAFAASRKEALQQRILQADSSSATDMGPVATVLDTPGVQAG